MARGEICQRPRRAAVGQVFKLSRPNAAGRVSRSRRRLFRRAEALDTLEQLVHAEGLAQVVIDAEHLGIGTVTVALVGGDHDDARPSLLAALELLEHQEAALLG